MYLYIACIMLLFLLNFESLYRQVVQSTRLKKEQMAQQQIPQQYVNQPGKVYYNNCRHFIKV